MRIIKEKTLFESCKLQRFKSAEDSLRAWIYEVRHSDWESAGDMKAKFRNASIINSKRVVFNIKGNEFRLIVDIEYKLRIVFVVWFGTHVEYDLIDVKTVRYES